MTLIKSFTRFMAVATAAGLILTPVAQADKDRGRKGDRGGYDRRGDDHRGHGYDRRDDRRDYRRDDRRDDRRDHRRDYRYDSYSHRPVVVHRPRYYAPRPVVTYSYGYTYGPYYYSGYNPRYSVGNYYSYGPSRTVYINDYDRYGLYAPPSGYHWVHDHDRGDAILASVATGAIIGLVVGALATD